jgi:ribosomal protein L12E/L44/L45/RPP1/RPP2
MKDLANWMGAIALVMACAPALAAEGETKKRAKAKAPQVRAEPVDLDQRVAESKFIFLGEGVRIYFLDRQYRETPYIRAADDGKLKSAVLVVKVVKPLQPVKGDLPAQILVPISTDRDVFGEGRSHYDHQVARLVGKQGIWFGDFVTHNSYGDAKAPRPLENPVTFFKSKSGTTPLPEKQLKEVVANISKRAKVATASAASAKAEPPNTDAERRNTAVETK